MNKCVVIILNLITLCAVIGTKDENWVKDDALHVGPTDFKDLQEFLDDFVADVSFKELKHEFMTTIKVCRSAFHQTSSKINDILAQHPLDDSESSSNFEVTDQLDDVDELFAGISELADEKEDIFEKSGLHKIDLSENEKPHYLVQAEIILHALERSCSHLPDVLSSKRLEERSPRDTIKSILQSLTKWMERSTTSLETKLEKFIDTCLRHKKCKPFLIKLIEHCIDFFRSQQKELGVESSNILQQLLDSIKWDYTKYPHLTEVQRLAITDQFDGFYKGEDDSAFNFAQHVSGFEDKNVDRKILTSSLVEASKSWFIRPQGEVEVDTNKLVHKVPETFLSVAFGSSLIQEHFKDLIKRYPQLISLASALSPSMLRIGGSDANFLTFNPTQETESYMKSIKKELIYKTNNPKLRDLNEEMIDAYEVSLKAHPSSKHPKHKSKIQFPMFANEKRDTDESSPLDRCEPQLEKVYSNFTMSEHEWMFLVKFVQDLDWTMLFDLNQFYRNPENNWDPSNAKLLFQQAKNFGMSIIWQLGNEPNNYNHKFNWEISPQQAAADYQILKEELEKAEIPVRIVGPDVTRPRHFEPESNPERDQDLGTDSMEFLSTFVKDTKSRLDAITFHQYYLNGRTATLEQFLSVETMNWFPLQLQKVTEITQKLSPNTSIWITETASAWGGGAPGLSNSFAGGFLWLDKLGAAALGGVSCIIRQTLYGGCYALLDKQLHPQPDFWISVLHKQLVGEGVLMPRTRLFPDHLRLYSQCLNQKHKLYKNGSVVLFGMNVSNKRETITLFNEDLKRSDIHAFTLSAPQSELTSRHILLNGHLLELTKEGTVPILTPQRKVNIGELEFLPYTIHFWVFTDAQSPMC